MNSARVPPRLVKRGSNAELIEFVHLLRFFEFIMRPCGVNRSGRAEATATPRAQSALGGRAGSPSTRPGRRGRCVGRRVLLVQIFCDRRDRVAPEVPPSDAKLPLNCRLLDSFVGIPAASLRVNPNASFCGTRIGEHSGSLIGQLWRWFCGPKSDENRRLRAEFEPTLAGRTGGGAVGFIAMARSVRSLGRLRADRGERGSPLDRR
jgi:hypothetical protein